MFQLPNQIRTHHNRTFKKQRMNQDRPLEEDRSSAQEEQVNVSTTGTSSVALVATVGDVGRGILSNFVPNLTRFPFVVKHAE